MRKGRDGEEKNGMEKIMVKIAVHYRHCQLTAYRRPTATPTARANTKQVLVI